jgi:hypothetical protein
MVITLWGYWLITFREVHEKLFYRNLIYSHEEFYDGIQQKLKGILLVIV